MVSEMESKEFEAFVSRRAVEEVLSQTPMLTLMSPSSERVKALPDVDVDIAGLEMWNDRANWTSPAVDTHRELVYNLVYRLILQDSIYRLLMKHKLNDTNRTIFVQRPEQSGKTNTCIMLTW